MELVYSGKVRDLYADGDELILVASDRVSVYDVVLPTPITGQGQDPDPAVAVVVRPAQRTSIANHVISGTDVPAQWAGRAIRCRTPATCCRSSASPAATWPASAWTSYRADRQRSRGMPLPPGLGEGSRLPGADLHADHQG